MRSLNHENLLRLYYIYESENSVYMVLELVTGGNLMSYLRKNEHHITIAKVKNIIR